MRDPPEKTDFRFLWKSKKGLSKPCLAPARYRGIGHTPYARSESGLGGVPKATQNRRRSNAFFIVVAA